MLGLRGVEKTTMVTQAYLWLEGKLKKSKAYQLASS